MWGAGRRGAHILWSPSLRRGRAVSKESGRVTELHRTGRQGRTCHCYPVRQILLLSPPEGKGAAGRENRVPMRRHSVCITAGARAGCSGTARPEPWWPPQHPAAFSCVCRKGRPSYHPGLASSHAETFPPRCLCSTRSLNVMQTSRQGSRDSRGGDGTEALLPRRVPDLQLHLLPIDLHSPDLEIHSDCGDVAACRNAAHYSG